MALSLMEAAKTVSGQVQRQAIIEIFAKSHPILGAMQFEDIPGNALAYNQESTLPGIAFRGLNEGYTESTGVVNPQTEQLTIAGGDLDVDLAILKTLGMGQRGAQEAMKVKALAHAVGHKIIKGDSSASSKEFDGLQRRLVVGGAQVISNGSTSGGDPLSLSKLDEAIDAVDAPTHLIMSKAQRRWFRRAVSSTSVGGFITQTRDEFGRPVDAYNGLPILIADPNDAVYATLAYDEAGAGGGSTATSIYVCSFGPATLVGLQNGTIDVRDLGEQDAKPVMRTRVEWLMSMCLLHPRAAARLYGISNAAIVV